MKRITIVASLIIAVALATPAPAAPNGGLTVPDFTKGERIPAGAKHDWNLGPTGLRGWMFCDKMVTTDARQVSITNVVKGSPADGVFKVADVILGVGGKPFSYDPRTELGKAVTAAESEAGEGKLTLTRWREGKTDEVVLMLPVLGNYSDTAPYDCPKSKRILEQGCKAIAVRIADPSYSEGPNQDPITRSLNALALLASGNPEYLPLVKKEAQWAADFSSRHMQTWHYSYCIMLLSEYVMATDDRSVMPGLRRLALEAAKGQSAVGSWGHGFAVPDGRLGGYGMMNSPGVPLTISLVMAREAGVKDPEVSRAIELSARLLRFYIGKGAIPYGDHHPWIPAIHQAVIEPAPSGEMFADSIRVEGLRLLAKHRIEEGISACVKYTRDQNPWDSQTRTPELMKVLLSYGTHAKTVIPELTKIADYFEKDEKNFPPELMRMKAKSVRETICAIEAMTDAPELIRLK